MRPPPAVPPLAPLWSSLQRPSLAREDYLDPRWWRRRSVHSVGVAGSLNPDAAWDERQAREQKPPFAIGRRHRRPQWAVAPEERSRGRAERSALRPPSQRREPAKGQPSGARLVRGPGLAGGGSSRPAPPGRQATTATTPSVNNTTTAMRRLRHCEVMMLLERGRGESKSLAGDWRLRHPPSTINPGHRSHSSVRVVTLYQILHTRFATSPECRLSLVRHENHCLLLRHRSPSRLRSGQGSFRHRRRFGWRTCFDVDSRRRRPAARRRPTSAIG